MNMTNISNIVRQIVASVEFRSTLGFRAARDVALGVIFDERSGLSVGGPGQDERQRMEGAVERALRECLNGLSPELRNALAEPKVRTIVVRATAARLYQLLDARVP